MLTTTSTFTITALPSEDVEAIRRSTHMHGNPVRSHTDDGGAPCRHCLRAAAPGERILLASYRPFALENPYAEIGPIFVHAETCSRYEAREHFPADFAPRRFVLRKYDAEHNNLGGELIGERDPSETIAAIFADAHVAYLHARFFGAGCYAFRIDRA